LGHSKGTSCRTPLAKILDPPLSIGMLRRDISRRFIIIIIIIIIFKAIYLLGYYF